MRDDEDEDVAADIPAEPMQGGDDGPEWMRQQLIEVVQGLNNLRVDWEEGDQRQRQFETRVDQHFIESEQRRLQFEEEMREYMRRMASRAGHSGAGYSGDGQGDDDDDQAGGQD